MSAKEREEWYNGPVGMSKKGLEEFRKRVINEEIKRVHFMSKQRLKDLENETYGVLKELDEKHKKDSNK